MLQLAINRVISASSTLPTPAGWGSVCGILLLTGATCYPFGRLTGFLQNDRVRDTGIVWKGTAVALVSPALVEETIFRAALLPAPSEILYSSPLANSAAIFLPLIAFVAYHLVNPRPASRRVFWDWRFLTMAAVLGLACTAAYYATSGSLLAATLVHWVPVVVWGFWLGGYQKLTKT